MKKPTGKSPAAEKQRAYRVRQRENGVPTANTVAIAFFRILMSRNGTQHKAAREKIEDILVDYLCRRHPELTARGVESRLDEMVEDAKRIRAIGWFDTDMRKGDAQ